MVNRTVALIIRKTCQLWWFNWLNYGTEILLHAAPRVVVKQVCLWMHLHNYHHFLLNQGPRKHFLSVTGNQKYITVYTPTTEVTRAHLHCESYKTMNTTNIKECYCVAKKKLTRGEKTKPQTAMVITFWFWGLVMCTELYGDWSLHNQRFPGINDFLSQTAKLLKTLSLRYLVRRWYLKSLGG